MYVRTYVCVCVCVCVCVYIRTCISTCICVCMYAHSYLAVYFTSVCVCVCVHCKHNSAAMSSKFALADSLRRDSAPPVQIIKKTRT